MDKIKKYNQIIAAAKAGMNIKTACKYLRIGKLPSELKKAVNTGLVGIHS